MTILVDPDLEQAARLFQENFPASRLVALSEALAAISPVLWGRYGRDEIAPASLLVTLVDQAPTASK